MNSHANPGSADDVAARLSFIEKVLTSDPSSADAKASELLALVPGQPMALLFQGIARRRMGNPAAAIETLEPLCRSEPEAPLPHLQLGLALWETGDRPSALRSIRRAIAVKPDFSDAWLALADLLTAMADSQGADEAFQLYARHSARDPLFAEIARMLRDRRDSAAETLLRKRLDDHPSDVSAMFMLAEAVLRHGRFSEGEHLLKRCLALAPGYKAARHNHAIALMRQNRPDEALQEANRLLEDDPGNADFQNLKAAIHLQLLEYGPAIEIYEHILRQHPQQAAVWSNLGHALRTVGRADESVRAYRQAITLAPDYGEAFWNLANLKTGRFSDADLRAMRAQLKRPDLATDQRVCFHFAMGKALEERGAFDESFAQYAEGNRLRRSTLRYNPDDLSNHVERCKGLFTKEFFSERTRYGAQSAAPIFVIGLPRSGSTLVEQILSSHSEVEGTTELTHVLGIARSLAERGGGGAPTYPGLLSGIGEQECRDLGLAYLEASLAQRKRGTHFFIDKMPNNFLHLGLIRLMLPEARVIDVRRHPLACGMSLFRHLFAHGQHFSYALEDIGRYYRDYAELMAHFDAVLPGYVHRIFYESLVEDTETEVRRLLDYCGLPFEEPCLRFYDNRRAVSTASSEQVRNPIFRDALAQWQHYERWLDPLREHVGSLATTYPEMPDSVTPC